MTSLMLHKGARVVTPEELALVPLPAATKTWFPVGHATVLDRVRITMQEAGFAIRREELALSRGNARFFATLDTASDFADGVGLSVGIRNSLDKSYPIAFCAGHRVLVCDNLSFSSEVRVDSKHTRHGADRFNEAICRAVQSLTQFQAAEVERITHLKCTQVPELAAESMMLRAYERGLVSSLQLPGLIKAWRQPSFQDFQPRTLWSLWNAFTSAIAPVNQSNPQRYCAMTIALQGLFPSPSAVREDAAEIPVFVSA